MVSRETDFNIFDIVDGRVVVNPEVLLIPELAKLEGMYKEEFTNVLSYVYFMAAPSSPYANIDEAYKEDTVKADFPGKYDHKGPAVVTAISALGEKYGETPEDRLYYAMKVAMDRMSAQILEVTEASMHIKEIQVLTQIMSSTEKVTASMAAARAARDKAKGSKSSTRGGVAVGLY